VSRPKLRGTVGGGGGSYAGRVPLRAGGAAEGTAPRQVEFPVEIFETLDVVPSDSRLIYFGQALGSSAPKQVRSKFMRDNQEYLMTPRADGGAIGLRLKRSGVAIAAVRIQVGAASLDHIPRELRIMGRVVTTERGVQRWYDLPLTDEEIERGVLSGAVVVSVSSCHDATNHPIIDALEVFSLPWERGRRGRYSAREPGGRGDFPVSRGGAGDPTVGPDGWHGKGSAELTINGLTSCSLALGHALGVVSALRSKPGAGEGAAAETETETETETKAGAEAEASQKAHPLPSVAIGGLEGELWAELRDSAVAVLRHTCAAAELGPWARLRLSLRGLLRRVVTNQDELTALLDQTDLAEAEYKLCGPGGTGREGQGVGLPPHGWELEQGQ
ncbi:unnamed protein product, partial [Discosporangium mesarthrocarpum]